MGIISSLAQKLGIKSAGSLEERKAQYFEVLMKAMEDGVLSNDEIEELDQLRKDLGLKDDDIRQMRVKAFQKALQVVKSDGLFTPKEEKDLEKIRGYLGVGDVDVQKDRMTLAKMRLLYEIHRGNIPIDEIPGLGLDPGEQCHVSIGATLQEVTTPHSAVNRPGAGPVIKAGSPFRMGAGRLSPLPEVELQTAAVGAFTVTSRRIMFNSGKAAFRRGYDKIVGITVFTDGFLIQGENGEPRIIKLNDRNDLELLAAIMSRYMNPPGEKPAAAPAAPAARPAGHGPARPPGAGGPGKKRPPGKA